MKAVRGGGNEKRGRMRLTDSVKEVHGALVCQEIQEPHKLTMQAAGGRRDQGQESRFVLQVLYTFHAVFESSREMALPSRRRRQEEGAGARENTTLARIYVICLCNVALF